MKKILYFVLGVALSFSFSSNVKAFESTTCLYKNEENHRILVTNNGAYIKAEALDDFKVSKGDKVKIIEAKDSYTDKVYNEFSFQDSWDSEIGCKQYLIYVESAGFNEAYSTDDIGYKDNKYREIFYLNDSYQFGTPDNVTLKELFCTYQLSPDYGHVTTYSYSLQYDPNTRSGRYSLYHDNTLLWDRDLDEVGINNTFDFFFTDIKTQYIDNFNIRAFWNKETNSYSCPNGIYVDRQTKADGNLFGEINEKYTISYGLTGNDTVGSLYELAPQASYVKFKQNTEITGKFQQCIYSFEQTTCQKDDRDCLLISAPVSIGKDKNGYSNFINNSNYPNYQYGKTQVIYDFSKDYDFNTSEKCSVLPKIYTNCNKKGLEQCEITDKYKDGYDTLYENPWANNHDSTDVEEQMGTYQGFEYIPLICDLKKSLLNYIDTYTINKLPKLSIYTDANNIKGEYSIQDFPCSEYGFDDTQRCENEYCQKDGSYIVSINAMKTKSYCQKIKRVFGDKYENTLYKGRFNECISFNNFYESMVQLGIVQDLYSGCDFVSIELQEKIVWILNLLKIAGPILALGLGTLDFIKTIAAGDADKELKTAFKRFSTRILAAALLFVIPLILAFLMNVFLGNQDGYNEDNPFCNVVEWK